jgi:class 3 adenylate cyclase
MKLNMEGLPSVDYRVNLDYGDITLAKPDNLLCEDIFGTTVNVCIKINRMAAPNSVVGGSDLYEIARNLTEYRFNYLGSYNLAFRSEYSVYSLQRKKNASG